jgi:DNA polymerase III alpha subunit
VVAVLVAYATLTPAQQRLDLALANELRLREAVENARQAVKDAIFTALQPQLARQAKARAAALELAYEIHDHLVAETEVAIHERGGRPIEGWVPLRGDYAARVRERFGE